MSRFEQRPLLRDEQPPDDTAVVIRGGPHTAPKIARHAARTARAWMLDGNPLEGISVSCALDGTGASSFDGVLSTTRSYRLVHLVEVGRLRETGYELLPTAARPHFTLRPVAGGTLDPQQLLTILGDPQPNPFYPRGLRHLGGA